MLRDEDEFEGIDCPVCHRRFSTYARMSGRLAEHERLPHCRMCGEVIRLNDQFDHVYRIECHVLAASVPRTGKDDYLTGTDAQSVFPLLRESLSQRWRQ